MKPRLSIIIPVYNVESFLTDCLNSVLKQTFREWRCICIDDGSQDGSGHILDEYAEKDSRFIVRHKENAGVTSARRLGLSLVDTPFVMFMDADDILPHDALETLIFHQKKSGAEIVRGNFCFYNEKGIIQHELLNGVKYSNVANDREPNYDIRPGDFFIPYTLRVCSLCMTLYDIDLFKGKEHFPDNKVILGEDGLTYFSLMLEAKKVVFVPDIVYYYRVDNETSASHKLYSNKQKELKADIDFTEELINLIQRKKNRKTYGLKYYVVDNIYGKFRGTSLLKKKEMIKLFFSFYCLNFNVQKFVFKLNWKKWFKMWAAFFKMIAG